jgi:prepilin-type processing-associated H-X9-DG protein
MKKNRDNFERSSLSAGRPTNGSPAFTITELLVILASIAFLAATLLPALAKTKFRDQYASCTANLRQWGMVYAAYVSQDKQNRLPGFYINFAAGAALWDVSTNMANNLQPLGVTVPMWFCPVKPQDFQSIQAANPGINITDVRQFVNLNGIQLLHAYLTIFYSVYIPRDNPTGWWPFDSTVPISGFPPAVPQIANTNLFDWPTPWPKSALDKTAVYNPIMTDRCISQAAQTTANPYPFDTYALQENGHPYGNKVINLNLLYADGHVTTHQHDQILWVWFNSQMESNYGGGWNYY